MRETASEPFPVDILAPAAFNRSVSSYAPWPLRAAESPDPGPAAPRSS
eukprot:CAMPEP_0170632600 /NCGR_PEP_ID=MMETSP0224-20130122/35418_1 /TAXON_ID=285029 /ORGANISM="Togula jolla, Strain CCCM 725" /LENGTH=47 /DNA_ID= /DNA_START= /DNA_END= /DNA_ORIENTATION=